MLLLMSLSFFTMSLFCVAMTKHRKQVFDLNVNNAIVLTFKPLAWLALLGTAYLSVKFYGWSIGPAVFVGVLTAAIFTIVLLVTYRAKSLPRLAVVLPLVAIVYSWWQSTLM